MPLAEECLSQLKKCHFDSSIVPTCDSQFHWREHSVLRVMASYFQSRRADGLKFVLVTGRHTRPVLLM